MQNLGHGVGEVTLIPITEKSNLYCLPWKLLPNSTKWP